MDAILAQTSRCHSTAIGDSPDGGTRLEGGKPESITVTRSQIGVCHPTLCDCGADPSGPLLYTFFRRWIATQRLEPTRDYRIGWKPRPVDTGDFLKENIDPTLDMS